MNGLSRDRDCKQEAWVQFYRMKRNIPANKDLTLNLHELEWTLYNNLRINGNDNENYLAPFAHIKWPYRLKVIWFMLRHNWLGLSCRNNASYQSKRLSTLWESTWVNPERFHLFDKGFEIELT